MSGFSICSFWNLLSLAPYSTPTTLFFYYGIMKTLYYFSTLVLASLIAAESSDSSDERYDIRQPLTRPTIRLTQPIVTQPIATLPKLSCQRCVQRCLFDDDTDNTAVNVGHDSTINVADAANEKLKLDSPGHCRDCINRCGPRMCARMGLSNIRDRADSLQQGTNNEAQTEWGWGGFGGLGGFGFGWGGWW